MITKILTTIAMLHVTLSGSSDHVDELVAQLRNKDAKIRASAANGLGKLGRVAKRAVPELARGLKDEDGLVRFQCACALRALGRDAADAAGALVEALDDPTATAEEARQALAELELAAMPALVKALAKGDRFASQVVVIELLADLGPDAKVVLSDLTAFLKNKTLRYSAARALVLIDAENRDAIPVLQELLKENDRETRFVAATSLAKSKWGAKSAVPTLLKLLDEKHIRYFFGSLLTLGCIGPDAREALPVLSRLLRDFEKKRGEDYAYAKLVALVAGAMLLIDPTNKDASKRAQDGVPEFVFDASSRGETAAEFAVRVLGQLGPAAKDALPALEKCLKHRNKRIQRAAQEAISKITQK